MATGLALVLDLIDLDRFDRLNKELQPEIPTDDVCGYVLSFASHDRLAKLDLDLRKFSVWARVAHSVETSLLSRLTKGKVGKMTIFCSEGISSRYDHIEWSRQSWRKELNRWNEFVSSPRYLDVSGHHHTLMGPAHVATFQAQLRAEVDIGMNNR
jgi:thioesterase domain-containing protein